MSRLHNITNQREFMLIGFVEEHTTDFNDKDGQYSYSLTLRCVRVTIVVV
jgi:hypothetical protein